MEKKEELRNMECVFMTPYPSEVESCQRHRKNVSNSCRYCLYFKRV